MPRGAGLWTPLGWAPLYALAMVVGRASTFPGETLAIVWPACGVAVLWLLGRSGRDLLLNVGLLTVTTLAVNLLVSGLPPGLAAGFVLVSVSQGVVGALLLRRLCPELWGCEGRETFDSVGRVFRLLGVAVASSLVAALIAGVVIWAFVTRPGPVDVGIHWGRNIYGCLAVVSLLHITAHAWRFRDPDRPLLPAWRLPEVLLLSLTTVVVCGVAFLQTTLPVAYVPAIVIIWAGLRFAPSVVAVHSTAIGVLAMLATVAGLGPFTLVGDLPQRSLLVQLLIIILIVEGLSIAAVRHHQSQLLQEARERSALLTTITDSIEPGLVVLDRRGRPTGSNRPAAALLELQPQVPHALAGRGPDSARATAWDSVWEHCAAQAEPAPLDLRFGEGRDQRVVEVRPAPMREGSDRIGTVVLLTDVTAERSAREGLTRFASTVAHDLRGPLARVKGWSHALDQELRMPDADLDLAATMAGRVLTAATSMDSLVDDLLAHAVSRDGALHPTTVSVDRVAVQVARTLGAEGQVEARGRIEVHADPGLVQHLVTNLIGNSLKYVAPGTVPHVALSARPLGDMVEVRVTDNGIGIPAAERERVFQQFHRLNPDYPGTGLGLSICRTVVERHGGEIRALGGGTGTSIVFTLPAPPHAAADATPGAAEEPGGDGEPGAAPEQPATAAAATTETLRGP